MDDKELEKFLENSLKIIQNNLKETEDILFSDNTLCFCYYIKYLENFDNTYLNKFLEVVDKMSSRDKVITLSCIATYLKENKGKTLKKQKIIKREDDIYE